MESEYKKHFQEYLLISQKPKIAFLGLPGAGKTTAAEYLDRTYQFYSKPTSSSEGKKAKKQERE